MSVQKRFCCSCNFMNGKDRKGSMISQEFVDDQRYTAYQFWHSNTTFEALSLCMTFQLGLAFPVVISSIEKNVPIMYMCRIYIFPVSFLNWPTEFPLNVHRAYPPGQRHDAKAVQTRWLRRVTSILVQFRRYSIQTHVSNSCWMIFCIPPPPPPCPNHILDWYHIFVL